MEGVSLVGRSVQAALASNRVSRVVVSTDDDAIAAAARSHGAEVVRRPEHLSGDTASSESALLHALEQLSMDGPLPPQLVFLQCTSPFTSGEQIDQVLAALDAPAVNSSFAVAAWHGFLWRGDGRGINHDPHQPRQRRQDLEPAYLETGAIYAMDMAAFRDSGSRFCPPGNRLSSSIPARRSTHPPTWPSAERWLWRHHGNFAGFPSEADGRCSRQAPDRPHRRCCGLLRLVRQRWR